MDAWTSVRVQKGHKVVAKEENPRAVPARGRTDRVTGLSIKLALSYDKTQGKDKTRKGTTLEVGTLRYRCTSEAKPRDHTAHLFTSVPRFGFACASISQSTNC
jgi:hypothetical protein